MYIMILTNSVIFMTNNFTCFPLISDIPYKVYRSCEQPNTLNTLVCQRDQKTEAALGVRHVSIDNYSRVNNIPSCSMLLRRLTGQLFFLIDMNTCTCIFFPPIGRSRSSSGSPLRDTETRCRANCHPCPGRRQQSRRARPAVP